MLALGERLVARGHGVTIETWQRWREPAERAGMRFVPAPEYPVFPTREQPLQPYEAVALAVPVTRAAIREAAPDVVVHDILTLAPALGAELEGVPWATLIPHVHPTSAPGCPPYAMGARPPRTTIGRALWRGMERPVAAGLERGRDELNVTRARLGLAPLCRVFGGLSERLVLVATFPGLEYPRQWPASTEVVGPLLWELPAEPVELPSGEDPAVLVAPSTAQDPDHALLRAALRGLAGEPVRVLAATNRRPLRRPVAVPDNARLVDWLSYARTMPRCAAVISHAGHGTVVRALASGAPLLCVPHSGDMGENAARVDWAGAGVRVPWRLLGPASLRWALGRLLADRRYAERAREFAAWAAARDGTERAAELVEAMAAGRR